VLHDYLNTLTAGHVFIAVPAAVQE